MRQTPGRTWQRTARRPPPPTPEQIPPRIPPPRSALTARLILAVFGFVTCAGGAVLFAHLEIPFVFSVVLVLLAAVALADIIVICRRKHRGEPG
jgi:hypothetical protein